MDATYLHANRQVVLLYRLEIQRMIHLDIGIGVPVFRPLLQIERVQLIRLGRRAWHQPIEHRWVALDSGAGLGLGWLVIWQKRAIRISGCDIWSDILFYVFSAIEAP